MSVEVDIARLQEQIKSLDTRLCANSQKLDLLMTAYQVQTGKSLVVKGITGAALAGLGAGAIKIVEWIAHGGGPPPT